MDPIPLEPVDALTVTTLDVTDTLLPDQGLAKRPSGPTCDALDEFAPDFLVPAHCTGWRATHATAARYPDAFIQNSVSARLEFAAATGIREALP
jgi:hypothetical protein